MFKSNFIISRSGASTLSEIITLGKASILIPYKLAKNNHQEKNAKWLVKKGGAKMFLENDLTKYAKDIGSGAVLISLLIWLVTWALIVIY